MIEPVIVATVLPPQFTEPASGLSVLLGKRCIQKGMRRACVNKKSVSHAPAIEPGKIIGNAWASSAKVLSFIVGIACHIEHGQHTAMDIWIDCRGAHIVCPFRICCQLSEYGLVFVPRSSYGRDKETSRGIVWGFVFAASVTLHHSIKGFT